MRIAILSDCQFDVQPHGPIEPPDADVLVVAGDHSPALASSLLALSTVATVLPVVYVAGNRDFYGEDRETALAAARQAVIPGLHFLENESVVIDGVRFAGATLWTDYELDGKLVHSHDDVMARINDHRVIRTNGERWTPYHALKVHQESRAFFESTLRGSPEPVVLVSHHAPARQSLNPLYRTLNGAFASDLSALMTGDRPPILWAHGATHHAVDYVLGGTRVVSNPGGYPNETTGYEAGKTVELLAA